MHSASVPQHGSDAIAKCYRASDMRYLGVQIVISTPQRPLLGTVNGCEDVRCMDRASMLKSAC